MRSRTGALLSIPLVLAACGTAMSTGGMSPEPADVGQAMEAVTPGTIFLVQLDHAVGGPRSAAPFGAVTATVLEPLVSTAGAVVIPMGARLEGFVGGHHRAVGEMPELIDLEFHSAVVDGVSHPLTGWVVHVDLGIADDGATLPAGIASVATPDQLFPGTVVEDPDRYLVENELGLDANSVISLGWGDGGILPAGARLTVEFARGGAV